MKITVLGAGAWGTALAIHFAGHGHRVSLWAHNPQHAAYLQDKRCNTRYLPNFVFPEHLHIEADMANALVDSELVLAVMPVAGLRITAERLVEYGAEKVPVLAACKGFEPDTGLLTFQVLQQVLPNNPHIGLLSGPSFAKELAQRLPCAVCLASDYTDWITRLATDLNTQVMRLYANTDPIGVAVGGAVKNVIAIATGLSDGLGCGLNARAALITRGLAEMTRLAVALGAHPATMMGLAGMGDLILTCTGGLSRNRKVGLGLAEGKTLEQVLNEIGHVAEGVPATEEVYRMALKLGVDMPVTAALYRVLCNKLSADEIVPLLMQREPTVE